MAEYYMILTEIGMSKLIDAQLTSSTINIKKFAVGDGGGAYYKPDQSQTALVKEVWRGTVSRIDKDPTNSNWIIVEGIIPATDGNFMIREVGLFDSEGDLIAIGNYPETFKPIAVSGSVKDLIIRCVLEVNNADNVELKIDPTTAIASKQYVDENLTQLDNKVMSQLVTLASYQPTKKVRYIAHRGMSAIAPENTIPAYELAGELGMWGAECDVTTTKDGAWVLMHDNTVDRTTNGTGKVSDFTLDEIKNLKIDAGNNVELYPNLRVPTFEEYLITCKKYGLVPVIEIKSASKNSDYDTFVNLIKKYGYEENCIVISFSLTALQEVRLRSKKIVIQYLANISETTINQVRELRNAGLDVHYGSLTKEKIELAHSNGLMVNAWTVNDPQIAKNLTDFGVDYITTDVLIEVI